jgi:hypothetical protein
VRQPEQIELPQSAHSATTGSPQRMAFAAFPNSIGQIENIAIVPEFD